MAKNLHSSFHIPHSAFRILPNILTLLRIVSIPVFIYFIYIDRPLIALIIFILASITDYYDGYIARKYNIITDFGKLADPLADKCLVLAALVVICLPFIGYVHWLVVVVIALREAAVTILRHYYKKKNIILAADYLGKIKTTTQMIGIIAALTFYTAFTLTFMSFLLPYKTTIIIILQIFFWVVAGITILSGVNYFIPKKKNLDKK